MNIFTVTLFYRSGYRRDVNTMAHTHYEAIKDVTTRSRAQVMYGVAA